MRGSCPSQPPPWPLGLSCVGGHAARGHHGPARERTLPKSLDDRLGLWGTAVGLVLAGIVGIAASQPSSGQSSGPVQGAVLVLCASSLIIGALLLLVLARNQWPINAVIARIRPQPIRASKRPLPPPRHHEAVSAANGIRLCSCGRSVPSPAFNAHKVLGDACEEGTNLYNTYVGSPIGDGYETADMMLRDALRRWETQAERALVSEHQRCREIATKSAEAIEVSRA